MQQDDKNTPRNSPKVPSDELSPEIDSPQDRKKLKPESTTIDMPDVNDIPGQENVKPAPPGDLAGTTASSDDEEGDSIFNDQVDDQISESADSDVTEQEKRDLFIAAEDMPGDDENLRRAALDNTDEDGVPLNEDSFNTNISPDDLDVPGAAQDDANERIGEEDEQNNEYSMPDDGLGDEPRDNY